MMRKRGRAVVAGSFSINSWLWGHPNLLYHYAKCPPFVLINQEHIIKISSPPPLFFGCRTMRTLTRLLAAVRIYAMLLIPDPFSAHTLIIIFAFGPRQQR